MTGNKFMHKMLVILLASNIIFWFGRHGEEIFKPLAIVGIFFLLLFLVINMAIVFFDVEF